MTTQIDYGNFDYLGAPVVTSAFLLGSDISTEIRYLNTARVIGHDLFKANEQYARQNRVMAHLFHRKHGRVSSAWSGLLHHNPPDGENTGQKRARLRPCLTRPIVARIRNASSGE